MTTVLITLYALSLLLWSLSFLPHMGLPRSSLVAICRGLWLLPLLLSLTPHWDSKELPRTLVKSPIHVLVDDSESMSMDHDGKIPAKQAQELLTNLRKACFQLGCELKETLLSQENALTKRGYTPLRQSLETWFARTGHDPWLVISDGADSQPSLPWSAQWKGIGAETETSTRGMFVGFADSASEHLWIEMLNLAPVSFEGRPSTFNLILHRKRKTLAAENVQVQVRSGSQILVSENVLFPEAQSSVESLLTLPPLERGQHALEFRVLAPSGETTLWDKTVHASVDVVTNTLGMLHLLGSPSWDGRFLRRYLKAEPKYDLISFFILRDPWDSQDVNERELSLIPFPVARLFSEELEHFRSVVLQNFNMLQFLMPEYQRNLVDFVKNGGSLLFLGGPRALQSQDLAHSPLRDLLPFDPRNVGEASFANPLWQNAEESVDKNGPWYDKDLKYRIALAHPTPSKRALADVFEEWSLNSDAFTHLGSLQGLHHMENVQFKKEHTPLLEAVTDDGRKIPLAVASYPGKGRAIWIFTDQLWRLAMTATSQSSRTTYNHLLQSAFAWLLRQDFRKPLSIARFQLESWGPAAPIDWSVALEGSALQYFSSDTNWKLSICDTPVDWSKVLVTKPGPSVAHLSGKLDSHLVKSKTCRLEVRAEHPAFGSVLEAQTTEIPEMLSDQKLGASEFKMQELAEKTGAKLLWLKDSVQTADAIEPWLEEHTRRNGVLLSPRFKTLANHFWIFDSLWFFFLLIFLPLEVLVRRWDKLRS